MSGIVRVSVHIREEEATTFPLSVSFSVCLSLPSPTVPSSKAKNLPGPSMRQGDQQRLCADSMKTTIAHCFRPSGTTRKRKSEIRKRTWTKYELLSEPNVLRYLIGCISTVHVPHLGIATSTTPCRKFRVPGFRPI